MKLTDWTDLRDKLFLSNSKGRSPADGSLLVSPPHTYGECFSLPEESLGRFEEWYLDRPKLSLLTIFALLLLVGVARVIIRAQIESVVYYSVIGATIVTLLGIEYIAFRLRVRRFSTAFPEAIPSNSRIPNYWKNVSRVVATSPVANIWFGILWFSFGAWISWEGIANYDPGRSNVMGFVIVGAGLILIFFLVPIWIVKVRRDFAHEYNRPLTAEALLGLFSSREQ